MTDTGIVILAAGSSSRLGRAKQLLFYHGKSLIQHVVNEALVAQINPVAVVTGANAETISQTLDNYPVALVYNKNWAQGMATGIATGIRHLLSDRADLESVVIAVCDQPFVSSQLLLQLHDTWKQSGKDIVACAYKNTVGTPVLFSSKYFDELMHLRGDSGAKKLLQIYSDSVATIPFPEGNIDIDTEDDYAELIKS